MSHLQGPPFLFALSESAWLARCAHTAALLTIPDVIADGEKSVAEIAKQLNTNEDFTFRLLRALVCGGIFEEASPRTFKNNVNSQAMRSGGPMRDMMLLIHGPSHGRGWLDLAAAVRTGKSGITQALGVDFWQYIEKDRAEFDIFNQAMVGMSNMAGPVVANGYDWAKFKAVLDLGGGHGGLVKHLLPKNPAAQFAVADLPNVCAVANEKAPKELLAAGVKWIPTDFFVSVPSGFDAVVMKHILHDWGDESSKKILTNTRKVIPSNGIVVLCETVVPERAVYAPENPQGRMIPLMDINMMAMCEGGKERTAAEWAELAKSTGFKLGQIIPCPPTMFSIIEMIPI